MEELGVLFELDLEKVYNDINWEFFMHICWQGVYLGRSGVIGQLTSTVCFLVLVKGSPMSFLDKARGWDRKIPCWFYCLLLLRRLSAKWYQVNEVILSSLAILDKNLDRPLRMLLYKIIKKLLQFTYIWKRYYSPKTTTSIWNKRSARHNQSRIDQQPNSLEVQHIF